MNTAEPLVMGIESSCDETGIGIVRGTELLTNTVSSSMAEHVRFGGVIPEIASRAHLAGRGTCQARDHIQHGGFAGARWPQQGHELALSNGY